MMTSAAAHTAVRHPVLMGRTAEATIAIPGTQNTRKARKGLERISRELQVVASGPTEVRLARLSLYPHIGNSRPPVARKNEMIRYAATDNGRVRGQPERALNSVAFADAERATSCVSSWSRHLRKTGLRRACFSVVRIEGKLIQHGRRPMWSQRSSQDLSLFAPDGLHLEPYFRIDRMRSAIFYEWHEDPGPSSRC